jgi:CDP-paratose 2-epimerase
MRVLITGGAGFIGTNTANHLLENGEEVIILDDLSRPGSEKNLAWLRERFEDVPFFKVDIRDGRALVDAIQKAGDIDVIFHFAAQVAVTSSVEDPRTDFEINALGTLNLLEAVREVGIDPILLYTSTNKVYGELAHLGVVKREYRYEYISLEEGVPESVTLDFYSPYGCSKGAADQYVRDYHRIYGLRTIVFRNSCIYGPRQFGIEDQGWLAWFVIAAVLGRPISIFGDGKQVRDVLYIDDLIKAMLLAIEKIEVTQGEVYNIGGGAANSLAVWSGFSPILERLLGKEIEVKYADWRPGDQRIFISDICKAKEDFGWEPEVGVEEGIGRLFSWVRENAHLFASS